MASIEGRNYQNIWNSIFTLFFGALFIGAMWHLYRLNGRLPTEISLFDFTLLILATFRLTRLFVYDKITKFFRDWFLDKNELITSDGELLVSREIPFDGPKRTMHELLACPWCTGIWFALFTAYFYFLTPLSWFPILVLAVGGVATLIQLLSNMIGWRAEYLKRESNRE